MNKKTQDMTRKMTINVAKAKQGRRLSLGDVSVQNHTSEHNVSMILRSIMLLVLMVAFGSNVSWADDYKYIFINNKGKQAFNFSTTYSLNNDKTKLYIHPKAKSVLATNFRFYTTEAAAVADATNGPTGTAGTDYYTEGTTISSITGFTNNTFYVRYDLVDDPAIDINGEKTYKLHLHGRDKALYYIYYDNSDKKIKMHKTDDGTNKFIWRFDSGDPYDVYITNLAGLSDFSNGVVSTTGAESGTTNSNKGKNVNYQSKIADNVYNQSADPMGCVQSFIIIQNAYLVASTWSSGMYQIMGAYNGLDIKPLDSNPTTKTTPQATAYEEFMPYYIGRNAGSPSNTNQLDFARSWRNEDSAENSNPSLIKFIVVTQKYTFHIINNSGEEAMSAKTATALNAGATITTPMIPEILKSPAACNYTFYPTAADAAAKTNPITTLPQDDDVYVRYETSSSEINLNGELKYKLSVGGAHYLYAADATTMSSAATSDATDIYRWTLHGGDPYKFTIKNVDNNQFITYDVSGGEAVPTLSGTGSNFFLHQSSSGKYELVVIDGNYPDSYYTLGYDGTLKLYSKTNHLFGDNGIQTVFTEILTAIINPLPTANNRTYDGATQDLVTVTDGACPHGTIWYKVGTTGDYTTTIPQKKYPGTYSVYYKSVGNEGYEDYVAVDPIIVTIAPAPVTVTAEDKAKTYGETDPTLTATVTGLISGEPDIVYEISRTAGEDANSYDIIPAGDASQGNYAVSFVNGTLTINPKTVGITWGETTFFYNGSPQAPTATATGLVNSDEIDVTVSGEQTDVGTDYVATASALTGTKAGNYALPSTKTTTFSIVKAAISTSIVMTEWSYGDYNALTNSPSLSYNPENLIVTYRYKVKGADDETYNATVPTNVGTYTVKTSLPETDNSYAQILTKDFTISQKALNKDDVGTPADGITITVAKVITNQGTAQESISYPVTVTHNVYGEPTTLTPYDAEHPETPYDYTLSGEPSVSGYRVIITAKKEGGVYTGNYTGFAITVYADPTFYLDGATWSPSGNEYAAVYLGLSDVVPSPVVSGSEIKAYIVNKVNPTIGTVTVSPVEYTSDDTTNPPTKANYIPEGVPVLLLSNNENLTGFTTSPTNKNTSDITATVGYTNQLRIAPEGGVSVKDTEAYIFYKGEFVLTKEGTIKKDYFYLYNPNYQAQAEPGGGSTPAPRRSLQIVVQDTETGINRIVRGENREAQNAVWFSLDGRRLKGRPTQKGIYITNGKKVIIK